MKTFAEVIQEDVRFASGTNQNYTGRSGKNDHTVVFFSKDTKKAYQERGQKTHGKMSHSIKHYGEFNLASYMQLAR